MKKCQHLFENQIYLISSKSIEGLKVYFKGSEKRKIRRNIYSYLEEICQILHLEIRHNEFHIILRIRKREELKQFYCKKHEGKVTESFFIPESSYIFGRQMSNLLVSFVKSYNMKFNRKGTMIDGRYRRFLLETKDELIRLKRQLKRGEYGISDGEKMNDKKGEIGNEKMFHQKKGKEDDDILFNTEFRKFDLRGCFEPSLRTSLIPPFLIQKIKIFRSNFPCGPNYN